MTKILKRIKMGKKIVQIVFGPLRNYIAAMDKNANMDNGFFGIKSINPSEINWTIDDPQLNSIAQDLEITVEEILEEYKKLRL